MRATIVCIKKEMTEQVRSGRLVVLGMVFVLFGIMNPAVAKLTPWLLTAMADTMAETGMTVTVSDPTALDSWTQFYKNIPMALIVFVLVEGAIFTREYTSGTMILSLTKGLKRYKVVVSKALILILLWTACFILCFGITYAYNEYYWDNSVAGSLAFSAFCWWLFGIFVIGLLVLFSAVLRSGMAVLGACGAVVFAMSLANMAKKITEVLPIYLTEGQALICGRVEKGSFTAAIAISIAISFICMAAAVLVFNRKQL